MPTTPTSAPSNPGASGTPYVMRVITADSTKKGAAAAIAGLLVAVVTEALWPSS